jgi:hypothetical protein
LLLLLPPIVGGCTGATPEAALSQPATRAEQWMTSYHSAMRQGLVNLRRSLDEHVELDRTALGTPPISGRDEAIALTGTTFPTTDRTHALDGPTSPTCTRPHETASRRWPRRPWQERCCPG